MEGMNMYGEGGFEPRSYAPVKVGDELEVTVEAVGAKGDGIAKKEGFVLFIPGVQKGDNVRIKITRVLRKVGFAEVVGASDSTDSGADDSAEASEAGEAPQGDAETPAEESKETEESAPEEPPKDSEDFGEEKK